MKRLHTNKKGVSTVISAILMIMVVMVGMSVAFASVIWYTTAYKNGVGSSLLESLTIEDVWFQNGNHVELSIYNVGNIPINVKVIYANNLPIKNISFDSQTKDYLNINGEIAPGNHAIIDADLNWMNKGSPINVKIQTERGSLFEHSFPVGVGE